MPALILAAAALVQSVLAVTHRIDIGPPYSRIAPAACRLDDGALPVVVADGLLYLPLTWYADPPLRQRLRFLMDTQAAARLSGNVSIESGLAALGRHVPLSLEPYADFARRQPTFLMVGSINSQMTWLKTRLIEEGARLESLQGCDASPARAEWHLVTMPSR